MLLKSITLSNFRQFKDAKITFADGRNGRNVTLVFGDNGSGKTSLANAFIWCLYGKNDFKRKELCNTHVKYSTPTNDKIEVKVVLELEHRNFIYTISRKLNYTRGYGDKVKAADSDIFEIDKYDENDNVKFFKGRNADDEINKILPRELYPYFFFSGEKIEQMSEEIQGNKKVGGFSDAVKGLLGLEAIDRAIKHLSTNRNSVSKRFDSDINTDGNERLKELLQEISKNTSEIEENREKLNQIDQEIECAKEIIEQASAQISKHSHGAQLQNERNEKAKEVSNYEENKSHIVSDFFEDFNQSYWEFFVRKLAEDVLPELKSQYLKGKDIPNITEDTIKYLKAQKECICGTSLDEGTAAYKNIDSLLKYIPPHSMSTEIDIFKEKIQDIYLSETYKNLYSSLDTKWKRYIKICNDIESGKDRIEELDAELTNSNADKIVRENQNSKMKAERAIQDYNKKRDKIIESIGKLKSDKDKYQNEVDELQNINSDNTIAILGKEYAEEISERLSQLKATSEEEMRNHLEEDINDIYSTMFKDSQFKLTITKGYRISIDSVRYIDEKGVEGSVGQNIGTILAFISSIIKIAKENKKSKDEKTSLFSSEPYPLVMEAPASTFDTKRIKPICEFIPQIAEQVIVFTKDTEGNHMKKYMEEKIGKELIFDVIDEYYVDVK